MQIPTPGYDPGCSMLQVENVTVRFGGVTAVDDVSLDAQSGEITGLIGPNGAGKTTTFNVICGLQEAVAGRVRVGGVDVTEQKPHLRARLGVARTFQRLEVFGSLTVADNLRVAAEARTDPTTDPETAVRHALARTGIAHLAEARVTNLPTGLLRLVELGRALAAEPRLLLLDEPGSGLNDVETERFAELLLDLAAEDGLAVLLVEHDVELVMEVCSNIHVLDFGSKIAEGTPAQIKANEMVQAAYLGSEVV